MDQEQRPKPTKTQTKHQTNASQRNERKKKATPHQSTMTRHNPNQQTKQSKNNTNKPTDQPTNQPTNQPQGHKKKVLLVIVYKTKENGHASAARFWGDDVIFSKVSFMRSTLPIEILIRFMQPFCIPKQLLPNRYIQPATKTESVDRLQFFMVLCCWGALELIDLLGMRGIWPKKRYKWLSRHPEA